MATFIKNNCECCPPAVCDGCEPSGCDPDYVWPQAHYSASVTLEFPEGVPSAEIGRYEGTFVPIEFGETDYETGVTPCNEVPFEIGTGIPFYRTDIVGDPENCPCDGRNFPVIIIGSCCSTVGFGDCHGGYWEVAGWTYLWDGPSWYNITVQEGVNVFDTIQTLLPLMQGQPEDQYPPISFPMKVTLTLS